jgi:energy-coupling factor transporter ATP-binding protein EcfA2
MGTIQDLLPKSTERMLIVGATGTGKTTLAKELLRSIARQNPKQAILIIDPKCTYDTGGQGYTMIRSPASLNWWNGRKLRLHYRPSPLNQTVSDYDEIYKWAYSRHDILVYTDETYLTMHHTVSPDWQRAVVTCGRELGVGAIFATQRPSGIDLRIYTESERKVCFYLAHNDDRRRMAQEMGAFVMTDPVLASGHEHAFWYWDSRSRKTGLAELNLKKG